MAALGCKHGSERRRPRGLQPLGEFGANGSSKINQNSSFGGFYPVDLDQGASGDSAEPSSVAENVFCSGFRGVVSMLAADPLLEGY